MNELIAFAFGIALFVVGVTIGSTFSNIGWRDDCQKLSAHISEGKVYKCQEVKP